LGFVSVCTLGRAGSFAACQSVDVGDGHRLAADPPFAAFDLLDHAKG